MSGSYRAIVLAQAGPAELVELGDADLPDEGVTIDVHWSSLNYKDGLAVTGKGKIARTYPMTCGIDLAGTVTASDDTAIVPGAEVIVTGWGMSETRHGGYTQRQRVPASCVTLRPDGLTLQQTMAIGTAGLTSMLCVMALEDGGVGPGEGPVVVTGATGGVGSIAVAILANLGYDVVASTGSAQAHEFLRELGATQIIDRSELGEAGRPLASERWAGAVDTVGSQTLASVLSQTKYGGTVAACGLAGGSDLPTTVLPFILRGVSLRGVDSVMCPTARRVAAWERLATDLPLDALTTLTAVEPMSKIFALGDQIVSGQIRGRVVIDTSA